MHFLFPINNRRDSSPKDHVFLDSNLSGLFEIMQINIQVHTINDYIIYQNKYIIKAKTKRVIDNWLVDRSEPSRFVFVG